MSFESTSFPMYSEYIAKSRYARWIAELKRREDWPETVRRYMQHFRAAIPITAPAALVQEFLAIEDDIAALEEMPSMRALMTAGVALERDNVAGYNCSYLGVDSPRAFDEAMYILMCGTGVGFSVEREFIDRLPVVGVSGEVEANRMDMLVDLVNEYHPEYKPLLAGGKNFALRKYYQQLKYYPNCMQEDISEWYAPSNSVIVKDSKTGWASALRVVLTELWNGNYDVGWDVSMVRPAGTPLQTFGGRASGPEPLVDLFEFAVKLFKGSDGRQLTDLECHDLMCKVADIVVVGGVRRSALISLSNLTSERMARAKNGNWFNEEQQRKLANNSAVYTSVPDVSMWLREWRRLHESKSGERGIFSRPASERQAARSGRRDTSYSFGTNPCSEIILRSKQFCNLSEVVVRPTDTLDDLKRKVRRATILGTLQATQTNFRYLSKEWTINTEEEALLGVSLTGIMDHTVMSGREQGHQFWKWFGGNNHWVTGDVLRELKEVAIETNLVWADALGINQSAAITCIKPSGTVSQLVDSSSGIHPRHFRYYIRRAALDKKDPLGRLMIDEGVPYEEDATKYYFMFPMKAPSHALTNEDISSTDFLKTIDIYNEHWCEHKVSCTIGYKTDAEFMEIGNWVYQNFDKVSGISFFPHSDHVYPHAPYEELTEEQYNERYTAIPKSIDWSKLSAYEDRDNTVGQQTLACSGNACEI